MKLQIFFLIWAVLWAACWFVCKRKNVPQPLGAAWLASLFLLIPLFSAYEHLNPAPNKQIEQINETKQLTQESIPKPAKHSDYKSLDIGADEFAQRFNDTVTQIDQEWKITRLSESPKGKADMYAAVKFKPTSKNIGIGATVNDDATLREIIITIGGASNDSDSMRAILTMLAASQAINSTEPKEHVSKVVTGLFQDAISHPRKPSQGTIGKYGYTLNFSPELGGMLFVISDNHAGQD